MSRICGKCKNEVLFLDKNKLCIYCKIHQELFEKKIKDEWNK